MIISDQTIFISLAIGVILGVLLVINKFISSIFKGKRLLILLSDFTFTAAFIMLSFVGAIAINCGQIRFLQVALELIAMLSLYFALGKPILSLLNFIIKLSKKLINFIVKRVNILKASKLNSKKNQKLIKKTKKRQKST